MSGKHAKSKKQNKMNHILKDKKGIEKKGRTKRVEKIVWSFLFLFLIIAIVFYFYKEKEDKKVIEIVQQYMEEDSDDEKNQILKIQELQKENSDIKAWIKIDGTNINYPITQTSNNDYYLKHDYKKQENKYGSIFLKDKNDINNNDSNLILYGHNMKDKEMFNNLLNYENKEFYQSHKKVTITTETEIREYEIIAAFKSRVFYKKETGVFRYYNVIDFQNAEEYQDYIENVKRLQFYETGVSATYGEQLLTMITCEYSQKNGRMVVVAKRIS